MLNGFTNVSITNDLTKGIKKSLEDLAKKTICVGIPDSTEHPDSKITNAELLYVHSHGVRDTTMRRKMQHDLDSGIPYSKAHEMYVHENGSPLWNSPPRPVLEPAMDNSKEAIAEQMAKVAEAALDNNNLSVELEKVGMLGQNIARDWFTNPENKWHKNSDNTIKRKGSDKPLIDTGELRKSITYTIKEGDS
ncbi:TPA: hypothetical protein ACXDAY_003468 [Clostridium botulinum]|uniref:hypothetical protein n=1 Tax=Clostridium botulinum TaxID=1491 RepID=UPI00035B9FCB|nr:hypothetical protein [Clostridium botulinum]EPS56767.1 putative bacteriophage protein [Clostridium botulinum Af84]MBN3360181.1 hypothetical protein [Clostridium botulinum]NFM82659.1 hypothetical protein [Clostridium botulinum]NFP12285.1 hypothetical protein [Clostridium botulinum]NFR29745.1 hypothetical protein [Clostridium botulinum]